LANLVNIWGESNADLIGDDSSPTLTLKNSSTGDALKVDGSAGTGVGLNVDGNTTQPAATIDGAADKQGLIVGNAATSGVTVAPLRVTASAASQAFISFAGAFISTASINVAASQTAFVIPVYHQTDGKVGYINVSKGVA